MEDGDIYTRLDEIATEVMNTPKQTDEAMLAYMKKVGLSQKAAETIDSMALLLGRTFTPSYEEELKKYTDKLRGLDTVYITSEGGTIACLERTCTPFCFFHNMTVDSRRSKTSFFSVEANPARGKSPPLDPYAKLTQDEDENLFNPNLFMPIVRNMDFLTHVKTSSLSIFTDWSRAVDLSMPHGLVLCPVINRTFTDLMKLKLVDILLTKETMNTICRSNIRELDITGMSLEGITVNNLLNCEKLALNITKIGSSKNMLDMYDNNLVALDELKLVTNTRVYNSSDVPKLSSVKDWLIRGVETRKLSRFTVQFHMQDALLIIGDGLKPSIFKRGEHVESVPFDSIVMSATPMETTDAVYWPSENDIFMARQGKKWREQKNMQLFTTNQRGYPTDREMLQTVLWSYMFTKENFLPMNVRKSLCDLLKERETKCFSIDDTIALAVGAAGPFRECPDQEEEDKMRMFVVNSIHDLLFDSSKYLRAMIIQFTASVNIMNFILPKGFYAYAVLPASITKKYDYHEPSAASNRKPMAIDYADLCSSPDTERMTYEGLYLILTTDSKVSVPTFATHENDQLWKNTKKNFFEVHQKKMDDAKISGNCTIQ